MITGLLTALIIVAIIAVIGWVIISIIPGPPLVHTVVWAVVAIICLLVLLDAVSGGVLRIR